MATTQGTYSEASAGTAATEAARPDGRRPGAVAAWTRRHPMGADVAQYSPAKILGIWALAALPMAILGWIVFPRLAPDFEADPLGVGVTRLALLTLGLIWLFVLSLIVVYREEGDLRWATVKRRLRLNAPREPATLGNADLCSDWSPVRVPCLSLQEHVDVHHPPFCTECVPCLLSARGRVGVSLGLVLNAAYLIGKWGRRAGKLPVRAWCAGPQGRILAPDTGQRHRRSPPRKAHGQ